MLRRVQVLQQCLLATHASGISQYPVPLAYLGRAVHLEPSALARACREGGFPLREGGPGEGAELVPKGERAPTEGGPAVPLPLPSRLVQNLEGVQMKGLLGGA